MLPEHVADFLFPLMSCFEVDVLCCLRFLILIHMLFPFISPVFVDSLDIAHVNESHTKHGVIVFPDNA